MKKTIQNGKYRYRPVLFFALTYLFTWIFWIPAAFVPGETGAPLMMIGLIAPAAVSTAFVLLSGSDALKKDMKNKVGQCIPGSGCVRADCGCFHSPVPGFRTENESVLLHG